MKKLCKSGRFTPAGQEPCEWADRTSTPLKSRSPADNLGQEIPSIQTQVPQKLGSVTASLYSSLRALLHLKAAVTLHRLPADTSC